MHGSTTEVLDSSLVGPFSVVAPFVGLVIVLIDLLDIVEALSPELTVSWVSLSGLLSPVSEDSGQLSFAGLFESITTDVVLSTEGWELSDSLQEIIIAVDWVGMGETSVPLCGSEE